MEVLWQHTDGDGREGMMFGSSTSCAKFGDPFDKQAACPGAESDREEIPPARHIEVS